jgi:hypothetical protein
VWGADAERVCVPEANAVEVPEDLDPAEVVSLVFTYMTAYQLLHRTARVKRGETVLVHGAAGRVGTAVLELGAVAGLRLYGTCSARDRATVCTATTPRSRTGASDRTPFIGLLGLVVSDPTDAGLGVKRSNPNAAVTTRTSLRKGASHRLVISDTITG